MTQKYNGFLEKIKTDLASTKSENTTLKEQLKSQEEELKAFKIDDQSQVENIEGQPEQIQDASPDDKSAANFKVANKVNQLQT